MCAFTVNTNPLFEMCNGVHSCEIAKVSGIAMIDGTVVNVKKIMTEKCQELALQNLAVPARVIAKSVASNIQEEYKHQLVQVLTAEQMRTTVIRTRTNEFSDWESKIS